MRMRAAHWAVAMAWAVIACAALVADAIADDAIAPDRPGIANSSTVVAPGVAEIEAGVELDFRTRSTEHSDSLSVPTLVRLGVVDGLELRVEGDTLSREHDFDAATGGSTSTGMAPTSAGAKWGIDVNDAVAVGVLGRVFPPSGSSSFRTHHWTGDLTLLLDWSLSDDWSLNPNLGVGFLEDDQGRAFTAAQAALTLGYTIDDAWGLFADTGLQDRETARGGPVVVLVDGGVTYVPIPDLQLDLSAGTGGSGRQTPDFFVSGGVSFRFDPMW